MMGNPSLFQPIRCGPIRMHIRGDHGTRGRSVEHGMDASTAHVVEAESGEAIIVEPVPRSFAKDTGVMMAVFGILSALVLLDHALEARPLSNEPHGLPPTTLVMLVTVGAMALGIFVWMRVHIHRIRIDADGVHLTHRGLRGRMTRTVSHGDIRMVRVEQFQMQERHGMAARWRASLVLADGDGIGVVHSRDRANVIPYAERVEVAIERLGRVAVTRIDASGGAPRNAEASGYRTFIREASRARGLEPPTPSPSYSIARAGAGWRFDATALSFVSIISHHRNLLMTGAAVAFAMASGMTTVTTFLAAFDDPREDMAFVMFLAAILAWVGGILGWIGYQAHGRDHIIVEPHRIVWGTRRGNRTVVRAAWAISDVVEVTDVHGGVSIVTATSHQPAGFAYTADHDLPAVLDGIRWACADVAVVKGVRIGPP